jgi:hypothetical protein
MKLVIISVLAIVLLMALTTLALADNPYDRTRLYYRGPFAGEEDEESVISFKPLQEERDVDTRGASLLKNRVKGPADLGIYYINKASGKRSCLE